MGAVDVMGAAVREVGSSGALLDKGSERPNALPTSDGPASGCSASSACVFDASATPVDCSESVG